MLGLYVHVPFCVRKCPYCAFNSCPVDPDLTGPYLQALTDEVGRLEGGRPAAVDTLYLGGGTPTVVPTGRLARLLDGIQARIRLAPGAEVTIEANPGTLCLAKARALREHGANRLSLGFQSLRDGLLKAIGRSHSAREALASFDAARAAGFANVGVDLIWGLPGQTAAAWEEDLNRVISLYPEHLSLYCLTLEKGTPLHRRWRSGQLALPTEDEEILMYRIALQAAGGAGYEHYEISNWARPGFQARHNRIYWTGEEYYGAGAGAHSFALRPEPRRWANVASPAAYVRRWRLGRSPVAAREMLSPRTQAAESLMLGLRMMAGIDRPSYRRRHTADPLELFSEPLSEALERGWLEKSGRKLRLTEDGILFSNEIFRRLF